MILPNNRIAFEAHRDQPTLVGTADIAQSTLVSAFMGMRQNPDIRPARVIEYLRDRAGLLAPRGEGIYAFPHLTFQEYLAACHLTDFDFPDALAALLRAAPNRWREVTLLAGAKAVSGTSSAAWTLADALCFEEPPEQKLEDEAGYWGALLAALVLVENRSLEDVAERHRGKVERIRRWLVCALLHNALPPGDRAQAGNALAVFGDPRFRADAWYLPDEPWLGFVEIPAGLFWMGSDRKDGDALSGERPQRKIDLPRYYIARYPVTVAQFRAFVDASGYKWASANRRQGHLNHPVVGVSWHDALAYCGWLAQCLREWLETPEPLATLLQQPGGCVTLPSEAEWEKAARGDRDRRRYPWGDQFDQAKCNSRDVGLGTTSSVGVFPAGASPYGCLDMAGNVWEWTRSLWGNNFSRPTFTYPYDPKDGREDMNASDDTLRVRRGGAFLDPPRNMRCAYRSRDNARRAIHYAGFRVAVAVLPPSGL